MEIKNGLAQNHRSELGGALSKVLADTYVTFIKTQNFHWNIHGVEFYALHILTEKQYKEMFELLDEIAERIRALGFFVEGAMKSFLKQSSIKETTEVQTKVKYIQDLLDAHESTTRSLRQVGILAAEFNDHGTSDMIGRLALFHEKAAWMLRSHL